jgi:hypothetical protein
MREICSIWFTLQNFVEVFPFHSTPEKLLKGVNLVHFIVKPTLTHTPALVTRLWMVEADVGDNSDRWQWINEWKMTVNDGNERGYAVNAVTDDCEWW